MNFLLGMLLCLLLFNGYFLLAIPQKLFTDLFYVDFLIGAGMLAGFAWEIWKKKKERREFQPMLEQSTQLDPEEFPDWMQKEVYEHNLHNLKDKNLSLQQNMAALQDEMSLWVHEIKLPLFALSLHNEQKRDSSMQMQIETINRSLNFMLAGCKIHQTSPTYHFDQISVKELVSQSIRNNSWFLIHSRFQIQMDIDESYGVITDTTWVSYVLDQIISNAQKYTRDDVQPVLKISCHSRENELHLLIEDNGQGILPEDLPLIWEKGYVGKNQRNGQYKSTGLGLYLARKVLNDLGIQIQVSSTWQNFTRFELIFEKNDICQIRKYNPNVSTSS